MSLETHKVRSLGDAAAYLAEKGFTVWASAIDDAILLNADMPNALKKAKRAGYQSAISLDCDGEDYAA